MESNRIKPDISAPGTGTRSCFNTSDTAYAALSGTSMATPHIAGAMALLWNAIPSLRHQLTASRDALNNSAVHISDTQCGDAGPPNNVYGWGRVDILAAVGGTSPSPTPTPTPTQRQRLPLPRHLPRLLRHHLRRPRLQRHGPLQLREVLRHQGLGRLRILVREDRLKVNGVTRLQATYRGSNLRELASSLLLGAAGADYANAFWGAPPLLSRLLPDNRHKVVSNAQRVGLKSADRLHHRQGLPGFNSLDPFAHETREKTPKFQRRRSTDSCFLGNRRSYSILG